MAGVRPWTWLVAATLLALVASGCGSRRADACTAIRIDDPHAVVPITGVDMVAVRVTNVGLRACVLRGVPAVTAGAIRAVPHAYGNKPPGDGELRLRPGASGAITFATTHSCVPEPPDRVTTLHIESAGMTFAVQTRMRISPACPPSVSGFWSGG